MPFVDRIIQFMQSQGAERITLANDEECVVSRPDGSSANVPQRLTLAQISGMLNEIMPDTCRSQYAAGETFVFPYSAGSAAVEVEVSQENGRVRVCIGPPGAPAAAAAPPEAATSVVEPAPPASEATAAAATAPAGVVAPAELELPPPPAPAQTVHTPTKPKPQHIDDLLRLLVDREASDLHVRVGEPPVMRIHGKLVRTEFPRLEAEDTRNLVYGILNEERRQRYEQDHELDLSHAIRGLARFRVNVFRQRGNVGAVLRVIPIKVKTIDELFLPQVLKQICLLPRGLFLVTGPTGSGKSTSLAAMIDHINENRRCHIITIEDPIEFMHNDKLAAIEQRELGMDTHSFAEALKHIMRQNPDVILVGEMRDLETIHLAITAAETGHLVFATLHTTDAPQTCDRIIDVFPPAQQQQVRMQLSITLQGVLSQTLLPRCDITGRIAAYELMVVTSAIRALIREGKTHQLYTDIQTGGQFGMQTLDRHLLNLVSERKVAYEEALAKSSNPHDFEALAKNVRGSVAGAPAAGAAQS
jgi:twitching motility protein PilT